MSVTEVECDQVGKVSKTIIPGIGNPNSDMVLQNEEWRRICCEEYRVISEKICSLRYYLEICLPDAAGKGVVMTPGDQSCPDDCSKKDGSYHSMEDPPDFLLLRRANRGNYADSLDYEQYSQEC
jgi:hypothetical protein